MRIKNRSFFHEFKLRQLKFWIFKIFSKKILKFIFDDLVQKWQQKLETCESKTRGRRLSCKAGARYVADPRLEINRRRRDRGRLIHLQAKYTKAEN